MCERFISAAWEYECAAVNFFRQQISPEEVCWVFPHHRLTAKTIGHLADCGAKRCDAPHLPALHAWVLPGLPRWKGGQVRQELLQDLSFLGVSSWSGKFLLHGTS